ncbi:MAG: orotate phosphoribosyltransferase [Candidatus Omnitrophota bacterium]|nr:MAG: orotate phosphoribosyltransferase [Candidatus Omnitrophota bacterium]
MTDKQILEIFGKTGAFLKGHFKLSSGLHSAQYLQCARVLQHPQHAEKLCKALAEKFKKTGPDIVIAPALGGILVSYEVARALGVKSLFMERVNGKMALRRGFEISKNDKVLIVEDVITTGLSTKEVIEAVKSFTSAIVGVGCLVDRSGGKVDFDMPFKSLFNLDMPTFKPENCPLCKDKIPLTKPGSRLPS